MYTNPILFDRKGTSATLQNLGLSSCLINSFFTKTNGLIQETFKQDFWTLPILQNYEKTSQEITFKVGIHGIQDYKDVRCEVIIPIVIVGVIVCVGRIDDPRIELQYRFVMEQMALRYLSGR